jgi:hypothetical protein
MPGVATPTPHTVAASIRDAAAAALQEVDARPEIFGGAYLDERGTIHILIAKNDPAIVGRVQALLPADIPVQWQQVRYSWAELERIHDEVVDTWNGIGIDRINYVAPNAPTNRVIVSIPAEDDELQTMLRARHGDAVVFVIEPPGEPL